MPRRRARGHIYRRKRTGTGTGGKPRTGYYRGYYVRLRHHGREINRYAGPDKKTAQELLDRLIREQDRLELLDEEPPAHITFEEFSGPYLKWAKGAFSERTYSTRLTMIQNLLTPEFGRYKLDAIKSSQIERFIAKRRAKVSGATCNRSLGALSSIFQRAQKLGYLRENPTEKITRDREATKALPLLNRDEQDHLLEAIPYEFRPLFVTALDTGMRLGELLRLERNDVEWSTGRIRVRFAKNKRSRMLHATKRVFEMLHELNAKRVLPLQGPDLIFRGAATPHGLRWSWYKAFKKAAARNGRPELRVHDLRHLCAINLVRSGMDLPSVQAVLGHTSLISTLRYAAYQDDTAASRAAKLLDSIRRD